MRSIMMMSTDMSSDCDMASSKCSTAKQEAKERMYCTALYSSLRTSKLISPP